MMLLDKIGRRPTPAEVGINKEGLAHATRIWQLAPDGASKFASTTLRSQLLEDSKGRTYGWNQLIAVGLPDPDYRVTVYHQNMGWGDVDNFPAFYQLHQHQAVGPHDGITLSYDPNNHEVREVALKLGYAGAFEAILRPEERFKSGRPVANREVFNWFLSNMALDLEKGRERWATSLTDQRKQFIEELSKMNKYAPKRVKEVSDLLLGIRGHGLQPAHIAVIGALPPEHQEGSPISLYTNVPLTDQVTGEIRRRVTGGYTQNTAEFSGDKMTFTLGVTGSYGHEPFKIALQKATWAFHRLGIQIRTMRDGFFEGAEQATTFPERDFSNFHAGYTGHDFGLLTSYWGRYEGVKNTALLAVSPNSRPLGKILE